MKQLLLIFFAFSIFQIGSAQTPAKAPDHFVIRGKAVNHPEDFWEFGMTSFMSNKGESVPITKSGTFYKSFPITHPQDIYLYLNDDAIVFFVVPGDTLDLFWDTKDFDQSFRITAQQPWRTKELELMRELGKKYRNVFLQVDKDMFDLNISDSTKYERIKNLFVAQVQTALTYPITTNSRKIFIDLYYQHLDFLRYRDLLSKYNLHFRDAFDKKVVDSNIVAYNLFNSDTSKEKAQAWAYLNSLSNLARNAYVLNLGKINSRTVDEEWFYLSPAYRSFIFDRVRFYKPFNTYSWSPNVQYPEANNTLNDCYLGATFLWSVPCVKDWYLTKAIMFGFEHYPFKGAEVAYKHFFPEIQTPMFRDTLQRFYESIQRLKPGSTAPAFTLKDAKGNDISLSDLKGKVVYIDFWGVYCSPCIYDIKNYAVKLHEKYKDKNVAFVNICVDVNAKTWKENLEKLHLDGINLLAEGWSKHPVCAAYNVHGIPHYVLIDKEGRIVDNNAGGPDAFLEKQENQIDKLLK